MVIEMYNRGEVMKRRLEELRQPLDYYDQDRQDRLWRQQHKGLMVTVWTGAVVLCVSVWVVVWRWVW